MHLIIFKLFSFPSFSSDSNIFLKLSSNLKHSQNVFNLPLVIFSWKRYIIPFNIIINKVIKVGTILV